MEARSVRGRLIRSVTFLGRVVVHPTWAGANVRNALEARSDRRKGVGGAPEALTLVPVEEALALLTDKSLDEVRRALGEFAHVKTAEGRALYGSPNTTRELFALVYACCRLARPEVVAETGVAHGITSAAILRALAANGSGTLISVDLPHLRPRARSSVGAAVPQELRDRWRLVLGPSRGVLPRELERAGSLDIFVQDGSHTTEGQLHDYRIAWPHLSLGGVLLTDDIGRAFFEFASEVDAQALVVGQRSRSLHIGALRKR